MMDKNLDIQMEFAVQMTCKNCENAVQKALESEKGIKSFTIDLKEERVVVHSSLHIDQVTDLIETSGRKAIVRGIGTGASGMKGMDFGSGVSIVRTAGSQGVVGVTRFYQPSDDVCVVEGTVDGLTPSAAHALQVHELGDMSAGCESCGPVYGSSSSNAAPGDLGVVKADENGRAKFRVTSPDLKLWDIVGRSFVVHNVQNNDDRRIACGIIARSAGLLANDKKVCACDGVSLWDEKTGSKSVPSAAL